jgi:hypothetical protein
MAVTIDGWLSLAELCEAFGLSEESLKRMAKTHGLPLRRMTPRAIPGALESEFLSWLKAQPPRGQAVRAKRKRKRKKRNSRTRPSAR